MRNGESIVSLKQSHRRHGKGNWKEIKMQNERKATVSRQSNVNGSAE